MGKIVKYCSSCDEGFAEKFGFCPDCGAPLQAFEMNPIGNETSLEEKTIETASVEPTPVENEIDATPVEVVEPEVPAPVLLEAEDEVVEEIEEPREEYSPAVASAPVFYQTTPAFADEVRVADEATDWDYTHADDGGYYITVIQEKNVKQRNMLLMGASALMVVAVLGSWGYSLFSKSLDVGAIGSETSLAYLGVDVPMTVEEEQQQKKDKDDAGGGGGGGKEQPDPVNQGDIPNQTKNPIRPPDPNVYRSDNFELKTPVPSTEGTKKFEQIYGQWGDPNSTLGKLSSGPGSGGGMGTGIGTGVGSGSGTGTGSGSGSGYGSGNGDGEGSGSGSGTRGAPPPVRAPVTTPMRILARPKATYTDEARSNNIQGVVRLKITLLASGQVGSIVPVSRLPHGLTERAIAAARQIKFQPKMVNGVPVPVNVTYEYTFTIY
ncbi:MAG TPA: TonB family protein [Pyrinomonadaceae bacterium]